MDKKIFIYIGLIIVGLYLLTPVPYCKIVGEVFEGEALYSSEEILEVTGIPAMLLNVKGISMIPAIQDNSKCLCVKKENYEVNDIIFFFAEINGQFHGISHRIVVMNNEKIITKGDGNNWTDPPMTKESIVCMIPDVPRWKTLI